MGINVINSSKNETNSSFISTVNIHDTPSSIKYKYLRALKSMISEENKKPRDNKKVRSSNDST